MLDSLLSRSRLSGSSRPLLLALTLGLQLGGACLAASSPEALRLLEEGVAQLHQDHFEQALDHFDEALRTAPEDPQVAFFGAVALNRLGRSKQALVWLNRSYQAGYRNPAIFFELGWAMLQEQAFVEARLFLGDHLKEHPSDAQAHEFLGRAHAGLGEAELALESFQRALALDPSREDTVRPYQAALARAAGREDEVRKILEPLLSGRLDSPVARFLKQQQQQASASQPRRGTVPSYRFTLGVGSNNNVIALPDAAPLPTDISSRSGNFYTVGFSANFRFDTGDADTAAMAGYSVETSQYAGDAEVADTTSHFGYGYWQRRLNSREGVSLMLSDHYAEVQGSSFLNQFRFQPSYRRRVSDRFEAQASYQFTASNYRFPTTQALDRDGTSHGLGLGGRYRFPDSRLVGLVDYLHARHDTTGADFERMADSLSLGLEHPFAGTGLAQLRYLRTWEDYDSVNSLSPTGAVRKDDGNFLQLELSWPLPGAEGLADGRVFFRVMRNDVSSNVPAFDYDQTTTYMGITRGF